MPSELYQTDTDKEDCDDIESDDKEIEEEEESKSEEKDFDDEDDKKNEDFEPCIGMRVKKYFNDGNYYYGTIQSGPNLVFDKRESKEVPSWSILYDEDGDIEDMDFEQCYKYYCTELEKSPLLLETEKRLNSSQRIRKIDYILLLISIGIEPVKGNREKVKEQFEFLE